MVTVTFVEPDGTERTLDGSPGVSLMELAVRNGVAGIDAECGGACACATCHVHVDPAWAAAVGSPPAGENDMLDFAIGRDGTSRLSCQVRLRPSLSGLRVRVAARQR